MKILVTPTSMKPDSVSPALDKLRDFADTLVFNPYGRPMTEDEIIPLLTDCDGYLAGLDCITAKVLEACPNVKAVSRYGAGYDHNFVLDHPEGVLGHAATLTSPDGLSLEVWTDQPGMQVYSGFYIPEGMQTPEGPTGPCGGVALETQHFADSVNHPEFPSIILRPGETFRSITEFRFPKR